MNAEIIDSNRFAPYGEALDPVAKNARLTNSPFGYTGESHDIEGGLVYLRARYYEPDTMRFIQQDTVLGDIKEPLSRNLYAYSGGNPLTYTDPTGHRVLKYGVIGDDVKELQKALNYNNKYYKLKEDSIFGPKTEEQVKSYQNKKGLYPDGKAGDYTKKSLIIDNHTQLGYKNAKANYISARDKFLSDYLDHGYSLKVTFTRMGSGEHYDTPLAWTNRAIEKKFTKGTGTTITNTSAGYTKTQETVNTEISKSVSDNSTKESGVAIPLAPPIVIPIPNPLIIGIEIALANLFIPTVVSGGDLTYEQIEQNKISEKAKTDAIVQTITAAKEDPNRGTVIYRWGSNTNTNLTPREKDITGLSFSLTPPASGSYCATTLELVNMSGYLVAVKDGANHVSVRPIDPSKMSAWIASRPNAETDPMIYTAILKEIVVKLK